MGSRTQPWLHHVGPTMVARAWPRPSPRQLKDLRRPSASSRCFSFVSAALWWMDGWLWRPKETKAIYWGAPRSKGVANLHEKGLGRPAWARFGPSSPPDVSRSIADLPPFCMWALDVVFSTVLIELLVAQASTSFVQVPRVLSAWWTYPGSVLFNFSFLHK
jgi:hypothetical protein